MNREEAIIWIKQICAYLTAGNPVWRNEPIIESCNLAIKALEQSEQKKGKWIESETDGFVCSECRNGYKNQPTLMGKPMFEYCPVCGAKMEN